MTRQTLSRSGLLGDYYNAINWAFLLNVRATLSEPAEAIAAFVLAGRARTDVLEICARKLEALKDVPETRAERYWILATVPEAASGLDDKVGSECYLAKALEVAPEAWMPDSTKEQLAKLAAYLADSPLRLIAA